jgi:sigma-B regulation protein RsbQ
MDVTMDQNAIRKNNVTVTGKLDAERSILFLHGFGTDQSAWKEVLPAFEERYRIVLMDNMGAGQSDKEYLSSHHYTNLHDYARDLLDVCQALKLEDAIFVGHSVAAMIGVLAAIEKPRHFSKMVLIGASPRYMNADDYHGGFTREDIDALYEAVLAGFSNWATGFAAVAMGNPQQPELARHFAASIQSLDVNHALSTLCAIFQSDHRQDLPRLNKPTLLIQAREDIAVPLAVAEYLHRHIPLSQLEVINATGHLPHISAPAEVVRAMQGFLSA